MYQPEKKHDITLQENTAYARGILDTLAHIKQGVPIKDLRKFAKESFDETMREIAKREKDKVKEKTNESI